MARQRRRRQPRERVLKAAERYAQAFACYDQHRGKVQAGEPTTLTLKESARTPERIQAILPPLKEGIAAEAAGLEEIKVAVADLA